MKRSTLMLLAVWLLVSCGASSNSGSIEQGMIDAIKGYTRVIYQNDQDNFDKYMCQADSDLMKKQLADAGVKPGKLDTGATYDLSAVKWSIQQRSPDGSVVHLGIDSGDLKVTGKSGIVTTSPIPGGAAGIRLKNDNGWKVCTSASIK